MLKMSFKRFNGCNVSLPLFCSGFFLLWQGGFQALLLPTFDFHNILCTFQSCAFLCRTMGGCTYTMRDPPVRHYLAPEALVMVPPVFPMEEFVHRKKLAFRQVQLHELSQFCPVQLFGLARLLL